MEEELLRQILQELESQSGLSWLEALIFIIPALGALVGGLAAAWVGHQAAKRAYDSQIEAVALASQAEKENLVTTRLSTWRNRRYMELQDALAEYIDALSSMQTTMGNKAGAVFKSDERNEKLYATIYDGCVEKFESVRSSGRLNESTLKVADQKIGDLVRTLADDSLKQILAMTGHRIAAIAEFKESGTVPGSAASYWPEEHAAQLAEIAKRTHEVNEMIEEQISLSD